MSDDLYLESLSLKNKIHLYVQEYKIYIYYSYDNFRVVTQSLQKYKQLQFYLPSVGDGDLL